MKKILKNNLLLFIPLLILNVISLLNMVNAKLISSNYNYAFYKQLLWIIIGYLLIFIITKFKLTKFLIKYSHYLYIISIFLLILVLFMGTNINGAKCWLNIFGFNFQPSEVVKITLTLYLIKIYNNTKLKTIKDEFILIFKYFLLTIIPSILVFLEPDTGAIINYLLIFITFLFLSKLYKIWYIIFISIITIFICIFFISYFFFQDYLINILGTSIFYRMDRIINFISSNNYQLENSLTSIGASSFFGVGLNKILLYIPEAPTDFIFAFSIGNYGLFSALLILLSYLIIDIYLISNKNKKYIKFLTYSYFSIFVFHQFYNILMNIGLLPIMGIPLPFLSYGGTNTIMNFIFIGLIIDFTQIKKT